VTLESVTTFDRSTWTYTKALFGAALRFHFWHSTICLGAAPFF
jgi:hypothetical protein